MKSLKGLDVIKTDTFSKAQKDLTKKYKHCNEDLIDFLRTLETENDLGVSLGNGYYKVRIANSDKNKGKSAGYRLITLVKVVENTLYLVYIYDKSTLENISESDIDSIFVK